MTRLQTRRARCTGPHLSLRRTRDRREEEDDPDRREEEHEHEHVASYSKAGHLFTEDDENFHVYRCTPRHVTTDRSQPLPLRLTALNQRHREFWRPL